MDQQEFLSNLSSETRSQLTLRFDAPGLKHLTLHVGLIIILSLSIYLKFPGWQLLMVPQGILIVFLFTLLHEAVHQTAFRTVWLNGLTARVSGFLIFLPPTWFKYYHFAHHRFTQIPGKDPELAIEKPQSLMDYIKHISGIPTWIYHFKIIMRNATGNCSSNFLPKKAVARVINEAQIFFLVYLGILCSMVFFKSLILLWIWIFPVILGQPFLRIYLLAEHGLCPLVTNMFENTRTTFTNRFVRFIAWNMPYHTEHHVYPTVPFYKLPELHKIMQNNLINTDKGYTVFTGKFITQLKAK